jgi:hypothetical protein
MANPYQFWNKQMDVEARRIRDPYTLRKASVASSVSSSNSVASAIVSPTGTHSDGCPFSPGIDFIRRASLRPQQGSDLIYVAIKVTDKLDRDGEGQAELPLRYVLSS